MTAENKVTMPSPWVINFYYYFSYLTLIITWFIAPILLYVILTQSKTLKRFKWFIFNHSFWCLTFITLICLVKPLTLTPALAGMPLALIRENGSFLQTSLTTLLFSGCVITYGIALFSTIFVRYSMIFPIEMFLPFNIPNFIQKYLTLKFFTFFATTITGIVYVGLFLVAYIAAPSNTFEILQEAKEYDNKFFQTFTEPSLIFFSISKLKIIMIFMVIFASIFVGIVFAGAFLFIKFVKKTITTKRTTHLQTSLILSCIIQLMAFVFLLGVPLYFIIGCILFQISKSAEFGVFCMCIVCCYGIIDFLTTLFFVSPYKKYLKMKFGQVFQIRPKERKTSLIFLHPISGDRRKSLFNS